ncbi:Hypothetical protein R9X50_00638800 [Acrodontium crateriforme]|uniref:amidase n=1 Tax=Acrodontium crateriforme TaxID=150365 RepID=A0AAQ3RDL2_9PEZI|nr:Hypothetical protein R9X50_00638800 [Acrodontium crateriforme]
MANSWRDIAVKKQQQRASQVPQIWRLPSIYTDKNVKDIPRQFLTSDEIHITEDNDATSLVAQLASGKLKSVDVVSAFCHRAAIAQQLTNCLTEIFFDDAISRAKKLDEHWAKTGRPIGPLHGLPISLKDTFKIKGIDASVGVAGFCFKPAETNAALVDVLLAQGAVLYCKTNVPLTMAALDSHNNVFGRTMNPANNLLTAGGSSGGEGALVAMHGSPLGVGTDVGGSIRIPAMCNGLVGVKPSHGRTPYAGQETGGPPGASKLGVEATAGPIARSVRDCELFFRAVGDAAPWILDPDVIPQTWDYQPSLQVVNGPTAAPQPLRIGIMRSDGHTTPLPPIQNLMEDVARTLRSPPLPNWELIETYEIDVSHFGPQCVKTFNGMMSIDGANTWFNNLDLTGEPLSPWLQSRLERRPAKSLEDVRKLQASKLDLQTRFNSVWSEKGGLWKTNNSKAKKGDKTIDLVICPVAPHPTPPIDRWNSTNYTSAWNLLDLPAGVLPVRPVNEKDLQGELPQSAPLNGWDKTNRELWSNVDRRTIYLDTMMCVQVLAPKLEDRKLVEGMAILEKALSSLNSGLDSPKKTCIKNVCFSPVVWRIRLMLNYKRIPYRTEFVEFPDIKAKMSEFGLVAYDPASGSKYEYTVPVIHHLPSDTYLMDSAPIAEFLEETYPERPILLSSELGREIEFKARGVIGPVFGKSVMPREIRILSSQSQAYFRETRETLLGHSLEKLLDYEDEAWNAVDGDMRGVGELMQMHKAEGPFVLGARPSYTDFFIVGSLQSARVVDDGTFQRCVKYSGFKEVYEACLPYIESKKD